MGNPREMDVKLLYFLISACFVGVYAQFEVPEALVEPLHPKGFSVSIPDQEGIKLFAFHGKLNEELEGREGGTYSRDVTKAKNGRWTFTDKSTKVKPGDVLYYWTYVDYFDGKNKLGYTRDDQEYAFKGVPNIQDPPKSPCPPTRTKINKQEVCGGKVVFQENFTDTFGSSGQWQKDVVYAGEPDYEYVIYTNDPKNIYTANNILHIKPTLTEDTYGADVVNDPKGLDLGSKCTGVPGTVDCFQKPQLYFIIPPVLSARINTRKSFSFVYGVVEIRAKLPKGDWIYPELFLNPKNNEYGPGFESGQIRIAFLPGNQALSKTLRGGCVLGRTVPARNFAMKTLESQTINWNDDFHVFSMRWEPESISLMVDGELYGRVYPSAGGFASREQDLGLTAAHRWRGGSLFAPFDVEMYISIGVGVGGHSFTDGPSKPWVNNDPKGQKAFYRAKNSWYSTWGADSALQVDYVKVTAL